VMKPSWSWACSERADLQRLTMQPQYFKNFQKHYCKII
jgi:hypothetical protein